MKPLIHGLYSETGKRNCGCLEASQVADISSSIDSAVIDSEPLDTKVQSPVPDTMLIMAFDGGPSVLLTICVQSGPHCLLSKIFFIPLHITFTGLLLRVAEQDSLICEQHVIHKVLRSDKPGMVAWK